MVEFSVHGNCTEGLIDLSGLYELTFSPYCATDDEVDGACTTFLTTLNDSELALGVALSYEQYCDNGIIMYGGDYDFSSPLTFYEDDDWDSKKQQPYVIGRDTVYGEIETTFQSDDFSDLSIDAVYVCTMPEYYYYSVDGTVANGCFSSYVIDGPYTIIDNVAGTRMHSGHSWYSVDRDDIARFSFRAFGMLLCHFIT